MGDLVVSLAALLGFDRSKERHSLGFSNNIIRVNMSNIFTYRLFMRKKQGVWGLAGLSLVSRTCYRREKGLWLEMRAD